MSDQGDGDDSPSERTAITSAMRGSVETKSSWKYPRRYLVALMAFFGFCNLYALRVTLFVGIVSMAGNTTYIAENGTEIVVRGEFDWNQEVCGLIRSSFFYGYIVTQLPAGFLAAKYGGRRLFGIGVAATSVLTLLTPIFARTSLYLLLGARVMEGLLEGVTYPSMHAMWSRWAPPLERSKLATAAFSGSYFGAVVAFPVSGFLADFFGWPSIFVFFGVVGCIWSLLWVWMVAETPSTDKYISDGELEYIRTSLGSAANNVKNVEVPWKRVFMSFPVWAIIIAHFCENWGFYTLLTELPEFMKDVFKFDLHRSGALLALPYLAMGLVVQLGGYLADCLRANGSLTTVKVRKIFNCSGFIFQTIFLLAAAHSRNIVLLVLCLTAAVGFGGLAWSGFGVNHLDIAPPYASILMGLSNTFATIPGMISPIVTSHMVQNQSNEEWQVIFYLAAGIYLVGALFYGLFASGDEQPWARISTGLLRDDESSLTEDLPFGEASCD